MITIRTSKEIRNSDSFSSFISHHSSLQRRAKFTLIELLVVIAIIAILAGMLLPALNAARMKAKETDCLSRKKQFMQCISSYIQDHGDFIPGGKLSPENTGVIYPVLLKAGYMISESVLAKLSHCTLTEHTASCNPHNNTQPGPSAGVNSNFRMYESDGNIRHPYRLNNVIHSSELAYLADTRGWADSGCEDGKVAFSWQPDAVHFGFFHGSPTIIRSGAEKIVRLEGNGRAAISYLDGHVDLVHRKTLLQYTADSSFYNPQAR